MSSFHKNGQRLRSGLFTSDSTPSVGKNKYNIKTVILVLRLAYLGSLYRPMSRGMVTYLSTFSVQIRCRKHSTLR